MAIGQSSEYPLILAGNRDEFHARPAAAAGWWDEHPDIVGGRDLDAGGSWLALHRSGRFAAVTNYRDADRPPVNLRSRGHLVSDYLLSTATPRDYLATIDGSCYAGFNLIAGDGTDVAYLSNRDGGLRQLGAGIYGLSNSVLDTPWDKVERSKQALSSLLERNAVFEKTLLELLGDREPGHVEAAESSRLGEAVATAISAAFVVSPEYGTRCSTVVTMDDRSRWRLLERRFGIDGETLGDSRFSYSSAG